MLGGIMRHGWIYEVLSDLREYALANGLPRLALRVAEAEAVAREEMAAKLAREAEETGKD